METSFTHTVLGRTGWPVHRLGLSASYRPGIGTIHRALDAGVNVFFCYGFDGQMIRALRDLPRRAKETLHVMTGAYNYIVGYTNIRRSLEKRLRQLRTDYIDVFLFLGVMKEKEFPPKARDEMRRLKEEGKVRAIGMSCHDRRFAARMADELDVLMIRYNAAHRGAEQEIFPEIRPSRPGVVSYTATRWSYLLRRPKNWPTDGRVPTAGECYRFVLSHPGVDVCLTAPRNRREFEDNLQALERGPLSVADMDFMKSFGDAVHHMKKWFM